MVKIYDTISEVSTLVSILLIKSGVIIPYKGFYLIGVCKCNANFIFYVFHLSLGFRAFWET
jgi:hypothetical protein